MLTITLDWLAFTIKERSYAWETWFHDNFTSQICTSIAPTNGYRTAVRSPLGIVSMWNDNREEMGTHVILAGSTLRTASEAWNKGQREILQDVLSFGASITRMDLAVDAQDVAVSEHRIYLQSCLVGSGGTARNFSYLENNNGGKTLYIGSRQSERFIRMYDKAAEQQLEGVLWHRLEVETKGMVARSVASLLVSERRWQDVFAGLVRRMVDFPDLPDWTVFFSDKDIPVGTPKIEKKSDTEKWIEEQVISAVTKHYLKNRNSPAIARLLGALEFVRRYEGLYDDSGPS